MNLHGFGHCVPWIQARCLAVLAEFSGIGASMAHGRAMKIFWWRIKQIGGWRIEAGSRTNAVFTPNGGCAGNAGQLG
ncbi:hypothetical protein CTP10_R16920 [Cupriavidus sp. P-10]|uniref:hypothetical protein n=1 Tax=unclassified Cupriavidus TaxID=2640874 RepID=UPI0011C19124|nr:MULTISPECIES: hypothetical protein [unclassified Cupriavidus]BDB24341.1 hypothetical protein CTP10_R16920 [Cupriavidus sp. P-10]